MGVRATGHNHARVLNSLGGVELVGVADPGGDKFGTAGNAKVVNWATDL